MKKPQQDQLDVLQLADQFCRERGWRLTPNRRFILKLIWDSSGPLTAYQVLELMQKNIPNAKPITAYRALGFLLQHRLIHRIESQNAYVKCHVPSEDDFCQLLFCEKCGKVTEIHDQELPKMLDQKAERLGFKVKRKTIELRGHCLKC